MLAPVTASTAVTSARLRSGYAAVQASLASIPSDGLTAETTIRAYPALVTANGFGPISPVVTRPGDRSVNRPMWLVEYKTFEITTSRNPSTSSTDQTSGSIVDYVDVQSGQVTVREFC